MNKLYVITLVLLFMSCNNYERESSKEVSILDAYVLELKNYLKQDTLYIAKNNSNELIFKRYQQFAQLEDSIKNKMPDALKLFFSKNEESNYEKQRQENCIWDVDKAWDFVQFENVETKKSLLHISKPVFLSDKRYVMIYSMRKEDDGLYYMPPIQFYENRNNQWIKIYTLPSIMFNNGLKDEDILKLHDYVGDQSVYYNF